MLELVFLDINSLLSNGLIMNTREKGKIKIIAQDITNDSTKRLGAELLAKK